MVCDGVVVAGRRPRDDRPLAHVTFNVADLVSVPQEVKFNLVFILTRVQTDLDTSRAIALATHVVVRHGAGDDMLAA